MDALTWRRKRRQLLPGLLHELLALHPQETGIALDETKGIDLVWQLGITPAFNGLKCCKPYLQVSLDILKPPAQLLASGHQASSQSGR